MYTHPDFVLDMAREHQRELIEEAGRHRLLNLARLARRERKADSRRASVSDVAGTLTACGPREAAPAR
jgi:hypothetical protein